MIPIDEQIAYVKCSEGGFWEKTTAEPTVKAILASLERMKRIDSVQVPDYPTVWAGGGAGPHVDKKDYDALRDLLKRIVMEELK
jgi:hypothetical protein